MSSSEAWSASVFSVRETFIVGERTWGFRLAFNAISEFSVSDSSHLWQIQWEEMRQRILATPETPAVPQELAEWISRITSGVMPPEVTERAVPAIANWINSVRPRVQPGQA